MHRLPPGGAPAVKPPGEKGFGPQGGKWQVSQGGGVQSVWKRDGTSLFYLAPGGKLMEASVKGKGSAVEIGLPHQLFQVPLQFGGAFARDYAMAPDGQRFLLNALPQGSSAPEPLTLVTNWTPGSSRAALQDGISVVRTISCKFPVLSCLRCRTLASPERAPYR